MIKRSIVATLALGVISVAASAANTTVCAGCHGANFEKKALNVSKIVKDLSKDEIIAALKGYKDGSYGGAMKGTMKGQVANLSDKDIEDIANQIAGGAKDSKAAEKKAESNTTAAASATDAAKNSADSIKEKATDAVKDATKDAKDAVKNVAPKSAM